MRPHPFHPVPSKLIVGWPPVIIAAFASTGAIVAVLANLSRQKSTTTMAIWMISLIVMIATTILVVTQKIRLTKIGIIVRAIRNENVEEYLRSNGKPVMLIGRGKLDTLDTNAKTTRLMIPRTSNGIYIIDEVEISWRFSGEYSLSLWAQHRHPERDVTAALLDELSTNETVSSWSSDQLLSSILFATMAPRGVFVKSLRSISPDQTEKQVKKSTAGAPGDV